MPIDFYYTMVSPPCRAVMILAKQLEIELNMIEVDLLSGDNKTEEFEKMNPAKKVPVINDDGFILAESRVIMTYLVNQYSPGHALYPDDAKQRAAIDRILFHTMELYDRGAVIVRPVFYEGKWPIEDDAKEGYFELLKVLEQLKGDNQYLAGNEMSVADISYICGITVTTDVIGVDISEIAPGIVDWIELMKTSLPEYEELVGGPCQALKAMVEEKIGQKLK